MVAEAGKRRKLCLPLGTVSICTNENILKRGNGEDRITGYTKNTEFYMLKV
jgi:hypothetical protein